MSNGNTLDYSKSRITTGQAAYESTPFSSSPEKSVWHSPVPYLFGGIAAMLLLIIFSLLILCCSYWRLNRRVNNNYGNQDHGDRDLEACIRSIKNIESMSVFEEKMVVIMAGNDKPTFLATPMSIKGVPSNSEDVNKQGCDLGSAEDDDKLEKKRTTLAHENHEAHSSIQEQNQRD